MLKTARSYLHSSGQNTGMWRTDGQMDGRTVSPWLLQYKKTRALGERRPPPRRIRSVSRVLIRSSDPYLDVLTKFNGDFRVHIYISGKIFIKFREVDNRQTGKQTNARVKHNLLGGGKTNIIALGYISDISAKLTSRYKWFSVLVANVVIVSCYDIQGGSKK